MGDSRALRISPFRSLPAEILRLALKQLDRATLFSLRLTCKESCRHASPLAFEILHVWLEEQSLQRLVNIARDPYLHAFVKEVVLSLEAFYCVSYEQFRRYIFFVDHYPEPDVELPKATWEVYQEHFWRQQALERSGRDSAMMIEAIGSFPSLRTIDLVDHHYQFEPNRWAKESKFLREEKRLQEHMLTVPDTEISVARGGQQLRFLLRALAATAKKPEELLLRLWHFNFGVGSLFSPLSAEDRCLAVAAFAGLRRLDLSLEEIDPSAIEPWREEVSLTTILRAATELESLWIQLPYMNAEPNVLASWKDFIQIQRFSRLQRLHVYGAMLHEAEFVAFLTQSCQGLQELFCRARVVDGSWEPLLKTIRGFTKLQKVDLYDLPYERRRQGYPIFGSINPKPLNDYLFNKRSFNPWRSLELDDSDTEDSAKEGSQEKNSEGNGG